MSEITFDELSQVLASAGCQTEAAECHATLTGLICAGPLPQDWMAQVTGGGDSLDECRQTIEELRTNLITALDGEQMEFDLLLPGDDADLAERTDSLAHWCQGFLYGLTCGGIVAGQALPDNVAEVVSDLARLAEAEHEGPASEADEKSFVELREYVRVGAQLVFEELLDQVGQKQSG